MNNIGIIASRTFINQKKVLEFIYKLKGTFGTTVTVHSGGSFTNSEKWIKKYSLECNLPYVEHNPSYTGYNMYSFNDESYYGKGYHASHFFDRFKTLLRNVDILVIFLDTTGEVDFDIKFIHNLAKKGNKKIKVFK